VRFLDTSVIKLIKFLINIDLYYVLNVTRLYLISIVGVCIFLMIKFLSLIKFATIDVFKYSEGKKLLKY